MVTIITRNEYLEAAKEELGIREFNGMSWKLDNDYYSELESYLKLGNPITKKVYDSLSEGQRYHFNKHYNRHNDMVI